MFREDPADEADYDDENDTYEEETEEPEGELPTLGDIFGYDNLEDNQEAAADYIRKIQERGED